MSIRIQALILAVALWPATSGYATEPPALRGLSLPEALAQLQRSDLRIVYSDRLVNEHMSVLEEPDCEDTRCRLESILAPFGLRAEERAAGTLVVVRIPAAEVLPVSGRLVSVAGHLPIAGATLSLGDDHASTESDAEGLFRLEAAPGNYVLRIRHPEYVLEQREVTLSEATHLEIRLQPMPLTQGEVIVRPSHHSLQRSSPTSRLALSRDEIQALPHLGDDLLRTVPLLPGVTSNDITAQFNIRGGRHDEVRMELAGQELYDPFHLKDFDSALSVLPSEVLGSVDAITGAAPVNYGDRMGGVLHMTFREAETPRRFWLGLSVLNWQAGTSGLFHEGKGQWLGSFRRGTVDLVGEVVDHQSPSYSDFSGRFSYRPTPRHELRFHSLQSYDRLETTDIDEDASKVANTEYNSNYLWLTHQGVASPSLYVDTVLSYTGTDRNRFGEERDEIQSFTINDDRELEVADVLQAWNLQVGNRNFVEWGWQWRHYESRYDYRQALSFESPITVPDEVLYRFDGVPTDTYSSAYLSDQIQPIDAVVVQLGLRYDDHSLRNESSFSPRLQVAGSLSDDTTLRLGWGLYRQTQRTYELQVEDRDSTFYPEEATSEVILGVEHQFGRVFGQPLIFGAEVYHRHISDPKVRYENLYEPYNTFPEAEPDRYRFDPSSTIAEGIEFFIRGGARNLIWWANYTTARVDDDIDGLQTPRQTDQRHSFNGVTSYRIGEHWDLSLAAVFHTGRPTTPLRLDDSGELVIGPVDSLRLPNYVRVDVRASRRFDLSLGNLLLYLDVQNLLDRQNVAGFDVEVDDDELMMMPEAWPGIVPSIGVVWEF